ncbi:glycosyltransferase family 4 protein [Flavobacterium sp. TSSA_36]|uniref:glycosyltransferase family 4 protein n=1 Tax=Flavobacterium sp. TSSA_36 TaxID=3447669 RepID=UPI003F335A68
MNILFVFFTLPHLSQSAMYSDMVNEFQKNGHNVLPMAPITSDSSKSYISSENDIEVLRVKTLDVFSKNVFEKGFANLLLSYQYKKAYNLFWKKKSVDLVIVATPSVMFADFIVYVKKCNQSKVYLMQKDIFPQNAVDLGFMRKNSLLYNFFRKHELKLLDTCDVIGCTSKGNINYFNEFYPQLDKNKIKLLYNCSKLIPLENNTSSLKNEDIKGKFLVVFGGNMGRPQQLENVLNLAKKTSNFNDVLFLIIGNGTEVEKLREVSNEIGVSNLKFITTLSRKHYFKLISSCSLGLISLHQDFTVPNTPMKLNDYLNAGIPVLASIDRNNDLGELLVQNNMGKYAYADSPDMLFDQFLKFYNDKDLCVEFGKNGYDFCCKNLSVEKAYYDIIHQLDALSKV